MAIIKFSKSHEWIRIEGDFAVLGITDYAQKELGDIVFVELPPVGNKVKQTSQFGTVESTKAASELYAPISGNVVGINEELINNPQWINEEPMVRGWMIKVKIEDKKELDSLLDEGSYKEYVKKESR